MVQKWKAMDEAEEPQRRRPMITRSSINRKPLSNLTNIPPKPHQSTKPKPRTPALSSKSGSSIGSTLNVLTDPIADPTDHPLPSSAACTSNPDDWGGDENHMAYAQRYTTCISRRNTKSDALPVNGSSLERTWNESTMALPCSTVKKDKGKAIDVPVDGSSLQIRRNSGNDRSVPLSSSAVEKIVDKRKAMAVSVNEPSLDRLWSDGKERSAARSCAVVLNKDKGKLVAAPATCPSLEKTKHDGKGSSVSMTEKSKDKGKAIADAITCPPMKNAKNNMEDINVMRSHLKSKDKRMEIGASVNQPLLDKTMNDGKQKTAYLSCSTKDKGKASATPASSIAMKNANRNLENIHVPLPGGKIMDKGKTVNVGSSLVDLATKGKEKVVDTPFNYRTLKNKERDSSCPPVLKTIKRNNRNDVGVEDILLSKSQTDPQPIKKKRKCSSKGGAKEYVLPQDFIDQQNAYFKEIDEFELPVEEVSD